jgi:hypothetical protein
MKANTMTRLISEELSHIPRSRRGSTQNEFRMLYTYHRRRDLASDPNAPARNALFAAIRAIEAGQNAVSPAFEWEFFRPGGGSTQMMRNEIGNATAGGRPRRRKEPAR